MGKSVRTMRALFPFEGGSDSMSKRNIEIKVRLNRKEAEALNKRVKKSRLSREAYMIL